MKQQTITPKIIELAKKIVELWPMPIYEGCWEVHEQRDRPVLVDKDIEEIAKLHPDEHRCWFPIPDIGDCLEKLRELKLRYIFHAWELDDILVSLIDDEKGDVIVDQMKATALHESLLSAVLAVLEEGK